MATTMNAGDWIEEVNSADSMEELEDVLSRYSESGADYKTVEDAIDKRRAELAGEPAPDEDDSDEYTDDDTDDEKDSGRAKLALGDPAMGQTPDPEAVAEAEAEAAETGEKQKKSKESSNYTEKGLILAGTWVVLADTPRVPKEVVGHEACVTSAPVAYSDGDEQFPFRHQYTPDDATFSVQTRDSYSATVVGLTLEDFAEISYNGRAGLGSAG